MKELIENRNKLQEELNQATRLKKVSVIIGDKDNEILATRKMEKLIIDIEEKDKEIKRIKEEIKSQIEEAQAKISDLIIRKDSIKEKIEKLRDDYVSSGNEKLIEQIEANLGFIKDIDSKINELNKFIATKNEIRDSFIEIEKSEETEEVLENVDTNKVDEFIKKALDEGKSSSEIADALNKLAPSLLDEYVASDEFKMLDRLYQSIHYVDSNGEIENPSYYKTISVSDKIDIDTEKLSKSSFELSEYVNRLNELIEMSKPIREEMEKEAKNGYEELKYFNEYSDINREFKSTEAKCIRYIAKLLREAYKLYVGDRLVNNRGTDFTPWLDVDYLQDSAVQLMIHNFKNKAKTDFLPKDELRELGPLGFIIPDAVDVYAEKVGIIEVDSIKHQLNTMFDVFKDAKPGEPLEEIYKRARL